MNGEEGKTFMGFEVWAFYNLNGKQGLKGLQASNLQEVELALEESEPACL